jgi:hypothetical protein
VTAYRVYEIDGAGRFSTADWIEAEDDERAIAAVTSKMASARFELWQGSRLVARSNSGTAEQSQD